MYGILGFFFISVYGKTWSCLHTATGLVIVSLGPLPPRTLVKKKEEACAFRRERYVQYIEG
jgi:hypothetical protein